MLYPIELRGLCVFLGKYAIHFTLSDTRGSLTTPNQFPNTRFIPTRAASGPASSGGRRSTSALGTIPREPKRLIKTTFLISVPNQCTKAVRDGKVGKNAETPRKPRKNFPLWPHLSGQWAKKINGITHYFGRWGDPDGAEEKYKLERDDLIAGRIPRDRQLGGCTIQALCDKFLEQKRARLPTGEISQRSIDDYEQTCAKITGAFSENRLVNDLTPDEFARLRGEMAENYGAVRLGNEIIRIRCVIKFAFDWGLIATPVRYGGGFSKPKAAVLRRKRQKNAKRMFTPDHIRRVSSKANKPMKAMMLLGINCGFGNEDFATLPLDVLDLKRSWVDYARPKTAVERCVRSGKRRLPH